MELPTNRTINKRRVARFHDQMTQAMASKELETYRSMIEQYQREHDLPLDLIAASLAVLANGGESILAKEHLKLPELMRHRQRENTNRRGSNRRRGPETESQGRTRRGGPAAGDAAMATYRVEVGREHNVLPGNIVGAIANEAGLGNKSIGKIRIFDRYSTVDLPAAVPSDLLDALQKVVVSGRELQISQARRRPLENGAAEQPPQVQQGPLEVRRWGEAPSRVASKERLTIGGKSLLFLPLTSTG